MESTESKSVMNGVMRIQLRHERVKKICKDKETSLIEPNRLCISSNDFPKISEVKDTPVGGQFRNYIERGIQIVKKKIRLMKKTVHGKKLPLL